MANPSSLTITSLSANAATSQPDAQTIDTNGTVPIAASGDMDRLIVEIVNADDAALEVTFKKGTALHANIPQDLVVAFAAAGGGATAKRIIGPFESSRFVDNEGDLNVQFAAATGAPNATVRVYRLPRL
jgi:hypothetical protein